METPLKKRELWDESNMVSVMEAVSFISIKVAEAARHFSVPRKSLENRVKKLTLCSMDKLDWGIARNANKLVLKEYFVQTKHS